MLGQPFHVYVSHFILCQPFYPMSAILVLHQPFPCCVSISFCVSQFTFLSNIIYILLVIFMTSFLFVVCVACLLSCQFIK
jgi:hypothetical protein